MTVESKYRPRCYIDIEIDHEPIGRIVFELFSDICPKTCENFLSLCTGDKGLGKTTNKYLCYKGTVFHRIIKNFMIQSGDFESGNGTGGESIFGGQFNDENFIMKHDKPFLLSMANKGRNTNGSQFFITTQSTPHLDGKHTVFGHVISGHHVVTEIENSKTDQNSRPIKEVKIAECGELVPKEKKRKKNSSSELSSSSEEEKKKKKKKKKHSKKSKHEKKTTSNVLENKDEDENEDAAFSVDPGDIPQIPANNFLFRKTSPSAEFRSTSRKRRDFSYRRRVPSRSRSGRKIKGRGNRRYRTPVSSDERSGSETPPHWKMASSKLKSLKDVIQTKNDDESEEDQTPEEDFEDDDIKNPVLQSRLGESSRKDARMNIDENRRRDQELSPEHDFKGNNRKSDIFKKLIDEEKQGFSKQGWFEDTTSKQKERKFSPIRSKIVVKSSITSRNKDNEILFSEEDHQRYGKRRSRFDMFANRRPFDSHMEFSSAQDTRYRKESGVWHYTDTNKKESVDKNKSSSRDLKHLNALKSDLLKYTKRNKDNKKTESASTVSKSENPSLKMETPSTSIKNMKLLEEDLLKCIKSNTKESSSELDGISVTQINKAENMPIKNSVNDNSNLATSLQLHDTQKIPFLEETSTIEPRSPIENSEDLKLTQNKEIDVEKDESNYPTSLSVGDSKHYDYQDFIQLKNAPIPMVQDELGIEHFIPESQCSTATSDDGDKKSPAYNAPLPDIIPLPEEVISIKDASIAALEDRRREIIASLGESEDKLEKVESDIEVNEDNSVATYKHSRNESSKDLRTDCSPESSKFSEIQSSKRCNNSIESLEMFTSKKPEKSKSPSDYKPTISTRSRSSIDHHSKSPVRHNKSPGPHKRRSTTNRHSKSRSRSRSRRRSISRNRSYRRYSRSPDFRQRRSRSHPRNIARGIRSYHYSGIRNRSPERRGSYQRRYGRISPHRERTRGSASRRSITRSRSRSVNKRRRRRHQSSSSSSSSTSSSSHSEKNRKKKNIAKGKKRRSSSSSSSSRSKRSNSHST